MDTHSEERLAHVHPALALRVRAVCAALLQQHGYEFRIVQGLRTFAEQDELFKVGRTKPGHVVTNARGGQSNHNYGLAVDLCPFKGGQPQWNDVRAFAYLGSEAVKHGLEWGGHFHAIIDQPHVQLPGLSVAQCLARYRTGGLPLVWSEADRHLPK